MWAWSASSPSLAWSHRYVAHLSMCRSFCSLWRARWARMRLWRSSLFARACGLSCGRLHRHRRRASWSIGRDSFWGRLCQCRRLCLRVCRPQGRRSRGSGCCRFFGFSLVTSVVCRMGRDAGLDGFSRGSLMQWLRKVASGNSFPGKQCATLRTGHRQLRTYACLG